MEEKYNQATPQRPEGNRALDAALLSIDLPKYAAQLKGEAAYHENGKNAITVFKSEHTTITLVALKEGEKIKSGREERKIVMSLYVIAGGLSFESEEKTTDLSAGQLLSYHSELPFRAFAHVDSVCLLTVVK
ncbi:hypothetical protein [Pedobacter sp. ASV28]|uniref:hypothetical protein n=1 Tax=Pedobacter sp. ASV28 TaxID=2795123 RepID=UPI0018EBC193|nr:hypothetical protein [Pedobacter sp. ASV28]